MKDWNSKEIEALRKKYDLTRRELGDLTGVTVSSIYQWERRLKQTSKTVKILLSRIEADFQREKKMKKKGEQGYGKKG